MMPEPAPMSTCTTPLEPPPPRPLPATTPVMSPPEFVSLSAAQPHAEPFHLSTWFTPQLVSSESAMSPLVPPPTNPLDPLVVTAVMSPPELVSVSTSLPHTHVAPFHF